MPPELSVIIPTYNRADCLEMTIKALYKGKLEGLPAWELIVVDDGSTDYTRIVIENIRNCHHNIKYFYQKNMKQGAARNRGMRNSFGELLLFLGDDIIPESNFLKIHWDSYVQCGKSANYAAIGRTDGHTTWRE